MRAFARRKAWCALLVALVAPFALASGFHIYEQGAQASGQAVAFVARADDASAVYYNPAAMTWFKAPQLEFGFSGVFLGSTKFRSEASGMEWDMKDHTATPVHLYFGQRLQGTPFAWGFGVTTPFGLITDWTTPGFDGRYSAWRTDLRTFLYNLNGAVDLGQGFSAALGVDYLTVDLRDFSHFLLVPVVVPLDVTGDGTPDIFPTAFANDFSNLHGTGDQWGWNAALHYKSKDWAFGLTYRSHFDVKVEGTASFEVAGVDLSDFPALPEETLAQIAATVTAGVNAALPTGAATGTLRLPATMALGAAYTGVRNWEFELDVHRVEWSHFDEIPLDFRNNTTTLTDRAVPEDWENTTSYRFGAAWNVAPAHQLRAGVYTEDSPIPLRTLRPSIPDADRMGYSAGYGYHKGQFAIDVYYMYITLDDVTVKLSDTDQEDPLNLLGAGDSSRAGTYKSSISLAGITASYKF